MLPEAPPGIGPDSSADVCSPPVSGQSACDHTSPAASAQLLPHASRIQNVLLASQEKKVFQWFS